MNVISGFFHCIVIPIDGRWARWEVVDLYYSVGGGRGGRYHPIAFVEVFFCFFFWFFLIFLYFVFSRSKSFYLGEQNMVDVFSVSSFFLYSLCLWSLK